MASDDGEKVGQKPEDEKETAQWEKRTEGNTYAEKNEDETETTRWEDSKD